MSRTWNCELCGAPHWDTENPIPIDLGDKELSACSNCLPAFERVINELEYERDREDYFQSKGDE